MKLKLAPKLLVIGLLVTAAGYGINTFLESKPQSSEQKSVAIQPESKTVNESKNDTKSVQVTPTNQIENAPSQQISQPVNSPLDQNAGLQKLLQSGNKK